MQSPVPAATHRVTSVDTPPPGFIGRHPHLGWVAAISFASALAMAAAIAEMVNHSTGLVYQLLYIPLALAAYRYVWYGVIYGVALTLTYATLLVSMSGDASGVAGQALTRTLVFVAAGCCVAFLSSKLREDRNCLVAERDLAVRIQTSRTCEEVAREAVRSIVAVPRVDAGLLFLNNGDDSYQLAAAVGVTDRFARLVGHLDQTSDAVRIVRTAVPVWDFSTRVVSEPDPDDIRASEELLGVGVVPILHEGSPLGILVAASRQSYSLDSQARTAVELMAVHVGATLAKLEAQAASDRQHARTEALYMATRHLASTLDYDTVLERVALQATRSLDTDGCHIWRYDESTESQVCVAAYSRPGNQGPQPDIGSRFPLDMYPCARSIMHSGAVVELSVDDPGLPDEERLLMARWSNKTTLHVPLSLADQDIGRLVLVENERVRHFSDDEIKLVQALSDHAAVAINNASLHQALAEQALHDGLTGLYNHRYFQERLRQEIARARRYSETVSLLMLDVDDFKGVNDRHGHLAGDQVLCAIAKVIQEHARMDVDLPARYGGEEFALLLPRTGAECSGKGPGLSAVVLAERMREEIAATTCAWELVPGGLRVTVSIGVASTVTNPEIDGSGLISLADSALYEAKRTGKNRVVESRSQLVARQTYETSYPLKCISVSSE